MEPRHGNTAVTSLQSIVPMLPDRCRPSRGMSTRARPRSDLSSVRLSTRLLTTQEAVMHIAPRSTLERAAACLPRLAIDSGCRRSQKSPGARPELASTSTDIRHDLARD